MELVEVAPYIYELPRDRARGMHVPARIFADPSTVE